jgi:pectate lyase
MVAVPAAAQPAFPGAEGFGAATTGGRGGRVIHVTTLDEEGPGSLREALEASGPRIIVFDVAGVIDLGAPNTSDIFDESAGNNILTILNGDVTIAGESSPCGGITIRGRLYAAYEESVTNIIVRHVRVRPPAWEGGDDGGEQYDTLRFSVNDRVMLDHVSASFGVDETLDNYEGRDMTLQWSILGEAATDGHPEGGHNYGMLNDGGRVSVHHNLFAHNRNRNPALGEGPCEARNNVVYNVRHGFVHHNEASGQFAIVGNYYRQGPQDSLIPFFFDGDPFDGASYYLRDNYVDDPGELEASVDNPWDNTDYFDNLGADESLRTDTEPVFSGGGYVRVTTQSSEAARDLVIEQAGAFPRDAIDLEMLSDFAARTGEWGARYRSDLYAGLSACAPPADSDGDGISDAWESEHGLDPDDAGDNQTPQADGYPAIESYLAELAAARVGAEPPAPLPEDDAGAADIDAGAGDIDAGARSDGGVDSMDSGCGCRAARAGGDRSLIVMLVLLYGVCVRRRQQARGKSRRGAGALRG